MEYWLSETVEVKDGEDVVTATADLTLVADKGCVWFKTVSLTASLFSSLGWLPIPFTLFQ